MERPQVRGGRSRVAGFTLIELLVVIAIIGILIAIAIPRFLGARRAAQNRAAQTSLRIALTTLSALEAERGGLLAEPAELGYPGQLETGQAGDNGLVDRMSETEPELTFTNGGTFGPDVINLDSPGSQQVTMVNRSETGNCYAIRYQWTTTGGSAGIEYAMIERPAGGCPGGPNPAYVWQPTEDLGWDN